MQSSIVAMGREMRARLDTMDKTMFEYVERVDRHNKESLGQMGSRIEHLATACEHPQRAARASRVAFAPRGGSGLDASQAACAPPIRRGSFDDGGPMPPASRAQPPGSGSLSDRRVGCSTATSRRNSHCSARRPSYESAAELGAL